MSLTALAPTPTDRARLVRALIDTPAPTPARMSSLLAAVHAGERAEALTALGATADQADVERAEAGRRARVALLLALMPTIADACAGPGPLSAPTVRAALAVAVDVLRHAEPGDDVKQRLRHSLEACQDATPTQADHVSGGAGDGWLILVSARAALSGFELSPTELTVIDQRFGLTQPTPLTLEEAGALLGLTRSDVRAIEVRVMARLRHHPAGRGVSAGRMAAPSVSAGRR